MTVGIAGVGGAVLGYAASKMMGGGSAPSNIDAVASLIATARTGDASANPWRTKKFLMAYTEDMPAALYAFCATLGPLHVNNPEVIVSVGDLGDGTYRVECALFGFAGLGYQVYYNGVSKITLTDNNAHQTFTV
jgi:hypothetical protein